LIPEMQEKERDAGPPAAWSWWFGGAALVIGLLAVTYWQSVGIVQSRFQHFYGPERAQFASLLEARIRGYAGFLAVLFGASLAWAVCLRWSRAVVEKSAGVLAAASRRPMALAVVVAIAASLFAFYFSESQWRLFGYPCWDNYCTYAQLFADWLSGASPESGRELLTFMRTDFHANSPFAPFVVALIQLATRLPVIVCYRLAVALATAATLAILWRALAMFGVSRANSACLMVLAVTNPVVVRSAFFPQTDPFVSLLITTLWFLGLRRLVRPSRGDDCACLALVCTGVFVKLSFLPALALLPVLRVAAIALERFGRVFGRPALSAGLAPMRRPWLLVARDTALYVAAPLLVFGAYQQAFGLSHLYRVELASMWTPDTFLPFKVVSFLHAGAFFLILAALGLNRFRWMDYLLSGWLVFYLLSLWISPASGWDRFYLPLVPALCVVAGRGMSLLIERTGLAVAWVFVLLAGIVNYSIFLFELYL
jgi:hypothetical protein